jgi:hypothetical protein
MSVYVITSPDTHRVVQHQGDIVQFRIHLVASGHPFQSIWCLAFMMRGSADSTRAGRRS